MKQGKRLNFNCTSTYKTDPEYTESHCTYNFPGTGEFFKGLWNFIVFPMDPLICGASVCEILCNVHICLTARRQWGVAVKFIGSILSASVTIWHSLDNNRVNTHYIGLELRGCIWGICTGRFEESYKTDFTAWFHDWQIVMDHYEVIILSSNSSDQTHQCI